MTKGSRMKKPFEEMSPDEIDSFLEEMSKLGDMECVGIDEITGKKRWSLTKQGRDKAEKLLSRGDRHGRTLRGNRHPKWRHG